MFLKCCEAVNVRSLCYFICFNICIFLATFLCSTHRFYSINDVSKAITIYNLAESSGESRCKEVNSSEFICLPSVLFIGASKCGTTTLTEQLATHSKVHFVGRRITPTDRHREVHRFDRNSYEYAIKSIEYLDELASSPRVSNVNDPIVHYTPHYFFSPSVPFEVKSFYKHSSRLKFILMLRDPVDRALSSYWFKNSHLFQDSDKGDLEDFWNHTISEIFERQTLEECMCLELAKVVSPSIHVKKIIEPLFSQSAFVANKNNNFFAKQYGINLPNKCYFTRILEILRTITNIYYASDDFNHPHKSGGKKVEFLRAKYFTSLEKCYSYKFRGAASGHSLIEKGIYADQLVRWLVNFPSKSQFYLINYKTWVNSQDLEYKKLMLYLGLNISSLDSNEDKTLGHNMVNNSLVTLYENSICENDKNKKVKYDNQNVKVLDNSDYRFVNRLRIPNVGQRMSNNNSDFRQRIPNIGQRIPNVGQRMSNNNSDFRQRIPNIGQRMNNNNNTNNTSDFRQRISNIGQRINFKEQSLRGIRLQDNSVSSSSSSSGSFLDGIERRLSDNTAAHDTATQIKCSLLLEANSITRNETFKIGRLIKPNSRSKALTAERHNELKRFFAAYNYIFRSITDIAF